MAVLNYDPIKVTASIYLYRYICVHNKYIYKIAFNNGLPWFVLLYIEVIKTSSGLFRVTQAFALLHVMRRQGKFIYLFRKERKYTIHVNKIQQLNIETHKEPIMVVR